MYDMSTVAGIILTIFSIGLASSIIMLIVKSAGYLKLKKKFLENEIEYHKMENDNKNKTVEYSNSVLEFIRSIVGQIAVIKFRTFQDSKEMTMVSKETIKILVHDIATMANESINWDNIVIIDTFLTKEFYENYIIETSTILVKQMINNVVDDIDKI